MKNYIPKYEEFINENIRPDQIEKVSKSLAYSMPNHTKPDSNGKFSAEQVQKAFKYIPDLKYVKDKSDIQTIIDKVLSIVNESTTNEAWVGPFVFNDSMKDDELKAMYRGALDGFAYWQKGFEYPKADYKKAYQEIEKILKKRGINVDESINLTETTFNNFKPDVLDRKNTVDSKLFKKLMPKTSTTTDEAMERIWDFAGGTMFVHYQYFIVKPHGNSPDRPTYRIHNSQYWLNDTQLKWQNKVGQSINATLLTITDITDKDNEKRLGSIWVDTKVYLDEQPRVFEILNKQS